MYEFNEIQNKAFYELKTLIIYDLKKNNVDLVVDRDYFLNYYNNNQLIFNSIEEKEKISCTFNFYNYILDPKSAELFLEVFYFITEKKPWIFSNSFLNIFFDSFDNKKISILFYSSILIKTLTNPSYYRKSFYENDSDEIINADNWHESTNVLETQFILINNFIIYNNIKIFIDDINKKNACFSNLFKFISILKNENIIKERIIKRIHKKKIKTYKYWSIAEESNLMHLICETNFSSLPYTLINHLGVLYEKGSHFSKIILLCRKNWYSGEIFNVKDDKYIKKILNLKLYINKESLIDIQKMILESEKIKITEIKKKINDYSIDLKSIFNKKTIGDQEKEEIKRIQKYLNKLIDIERMSRMIENLKEEECKYLPIFFDFRGRNYFDDYLSPTFSRWTRISFYYGYYSVEDLEKVDNSFIEPFLNYEILSLIKEILKIFEIEEKKYTINAIFWLLIAIGKHFIDKSKIKIPLIDFIKEGYNYAAGYKDNKKIELKELIEIKHYLNIIKNLKKKENIKKEVILKDATASVLQNLIKILGPKNQEAINLSNLGDTNNWYDPYSHILNQFKKSFETDKKEFIYFKRSTIKKTIMTNPYSAGEDKCWEYFKKSVIKEFDIKENEKLDDLRETFKSFYNFVTDFFEELNFFKNSSKKIIDYYIKIAQKEKKIILSYEDSNINLIYFKHKIHYIDIKIDNEIRKTKKIKNIDYSKINYRKIFTSIRANLAHWLDAIFLRKLVNRLKNPIFTIHDEFAIDFLNTDNLIILANEIANEDIKIEIPWDKSHKFKIFSIFILI